MTWSFMATRLNGDGTETKLDSEVPLRGVTITEFRSAPTEISGEINPESMNDDGLDGEPLLRKWSSMIYAEKDGEIRAGGIFVDDSINGPARECDFMGMAGYPNGQPYTEASTWPDNPPDLDPTEDESAVETEEYQYVVSVPYTKTVRNKKTGTVSAVAGWRNETRTGTRPVQFTTPAGNNQGSGYPVDGMEPMFGIREVWRHLQSQPRGNIGLQIDQMVTGKKIGKVVFVKDIDTESGPLSLEFDPFTIGWWKDHDLGEVLNNLHENLPLEYREEHRWNADKTAVTHFLRYGHPGLGVRRNGPTDPAFIVGENVDPVGIDPPADEYVSHIIGLGAGEGRTMARGDAIRDNETRIRRAAVFEDKSARTDAAIATSARAELLARIGVDEVTSITVRPGHVEDVQHYMPGDLVPLRGDQEHAHLDMWVRIESKTTSCDDDGLEFAVQRQDRLA